MKPFLIKLLAVFAVVSFVILLFSLTRIDDQDIAMKYAWGAQCGGPLEPGLTLCIPFVHSIRRFKSYEQTTKTSIEVKTSDSYVFNVKASIHYFFDKNKAQILFHRFGNENKNLENVIVTRITDEVKHATQDLCTSYTIDYLTNNRSVLINNVKFIMGLENNFMGPDIFNKEKKITSLLGEKLSDVGIIISYINFDFETPKNYQSMLEGKAQIQELEAKAKLGEMQMTLKGKMPEGYSEAVALKAKLDILGNYYPLILMIEKWDGKLPNSYVSDKNMFKLFEGESIIQGIPKRANSELDLLN